MRIHFYRAKMLHLFIRTMPDPYYALNKYLWNERMKTSVEKLSITPGRDLLMPSVRTSFLLEYWLCFLLVLFPYF